VTNSISLFPTEDRQTLKTEKLKVDFKFNSYSCYLEISNNSKELSIDLDTKIIKKQILESISRLSSTYSHDQELIIELFKICVSKIDSMPEEKQDELAKYFVENINKEVEK
tara:strand:+ start:144 stop:476 length:333 start_codon:yes stop_codon:yes gene_type:complete